MDVACHGQKRSAPSSAEKDQWETVPSSLETTPKPLSDTTATTIAPVMDLTSNGGDDDDFEDSSPSPNRTRCSDNPPRSNHLSHTPSGRSISHNGPATASAPPPIKVEKLYISIWTARPAPPQLPNPLTKDALELLTKEQGPMLQRFFYLVIFGPFGVFHALRPTWFTSCVIWRKHIALGAIMQAVRQKLPEFTLSIPQSVVMTVIPRVVLVFFDASFPLVFLTSCAHAIRCDQPLVNIVQFAIVMFTNVRKSIPSHHYSTALLPPSFATVRIILSWRQSTYDHTRSMCPPLGLDLIEYN